MVFFIDGMEVGFYPPTPTDIQNNWQYGVVVYSNSSMSMTEHQLLIQSGQLEGPDSIIILDSIVYS